MRPDGKWIGGFGRQLLKRAQRPVVQRERLGVSPALDRLCQRFDKIVRRLVPHLTTFRVRGQHNRGPRYRRSIAPLEVV